jgi:outer membrane beta-barrel protein
MRNFSETYLKKYFTSAPSLCVLLGLTFSGSFSQAQKASSSLNTLGGQEALLEKASPSVPVNTYRVEQRRVIDRDLRSEMTVGLGLVNGGDAYYRTNSATVQYDFHINTKWSLGLRQTFFFNELTAEGKSQFDYTEKTILAGAGNLGNAPVIDYPLRQTLATVSFYPLYGKMSWFESTVSYFDFYFLVGGGQMNLRFGNAPIYTGGGGMAIWWNQHLTTRIEARYQAYQDETNRTKRDIGNTVGHLSMGVLF